MTTKSKLVTGLFKSKVAAEAAVDAVMKRGFTRDDISVLMSDATRSKEFALQTRTHAADGLGIGSAIGGTVGAVIAAIAAVGTTLFLPRSEEHTSELQSLAYLVCRLLLEKKKKNNNNIPKYYNIYLDTLDHY